MVKVAFTKGIKTVGRFFDLANNSITGTSFNPDISPDTEITSITPIGSETAIVTNSIHGLKSALRDRVPD